MKRFPPLSLAGWLLIGLIPLACTEKPAQGAKSFGKVTVTNTPQWTGYRGEARDGEVEATPTPWTGETPKIHWRATVGNGYSALAPFKGKLYTIGNTGGMDSVYCLDAKTGKTLWRYPYRCKVGRYKGPRCTPAVTDQYVYTVSREGTILCLTADKGKKVWSRRAKEFGGKVPRWGAACSPLLLGNAVILDLGAVIALDAKTGKTIWQTKSYGMAYSSVVPFTQNKKTYLAAFPVAGLIVLDAATGKPVATSPWETRYGVNATMPIVNNGKIFISSGYNTGCSLLTFTGAALKRVYKNKKMCNQFNTSVLRDGYLFGFSGNTGGGKLVCMELATGNVQWSQGGLGTGSVLLAGKTLVILGEKGKLVLANVSSKKFSPIQQTQILNARCWTMPTYAEGLLYLRDEKGNVVCLKLDS